MRYRDVKHAVPFFLQLWFFATPILYDVELLGTGTLRQLERLNPMGHIVISYQQMLFHGQFDHWRGLAGAFVAGIVALAVVAVRSRRRSMVPDEDGAAVRLSTRYWHFLEIVWAAMFLVFLLS